jgi:RNA polymerase sigma-70 factor, ECF subfamily
MAEHRFSESSEELLARCRYGDHGALEALYRRHERPVYSLLYRMLGNHDDAEEAIADVFVKVWRSAASFRGQARFTTWLYHVTANTARDRLRTRRGCSDVSFEEITGNEEAFAAQGRVAESPEKAAIRASESAKIVAALNGLSEEDRLLVSLHHLQDLGCEEISRITGIAVSNLKVKLFRARQKLRHVLSEMEEAHELRTDTTEAAGLQPQPTECP